jgi:hypothetical protein
MNVYQQRRWLATRQDGELRHALHCQLTKHMAEVGREVTKEMAVRWMASGHAWGNRRLMSNPVARRIQRARVRMVPHGDHIDS